MKKLMLALALTLGACSTPPKLPDPTVEVSRPPAELMKAPPEMKTIPEKK